MGNATAVRLDRENPYLRLHTVNIYVRDQDRSLRFYVDQLGFSLAFDFRVQSGQRMVAVAPPDGTALLRLIVPDPDSDDCRLIGQQTQISFLTEDVMEKFREWNKRGVRFTKTPRLRRIRFQEQAKAWPSTSEPPVWGGMFARFADLDGNIFSLVGFDEVSREIDAQRRAIAEKLEAERRLGYELEIARQVQSRLFPQKMPTASTLSFAGACRPARHVGGDYYDFLDLGTERLGLVIADIAGKGIAAALMMANLQAHLRSQCAIAWEQPQRFLELVNQLFYENTTEGAYATLFFAQYDSRTRRLSYANCGHLCALLLRSDGRLDRLDSTCTVMGLFPHWECSIEQCDLVCGDTLVLYTDGVTESYNDDGEEYGENRLIDSVQRYRDLGPEPLLKAVLDDVHRFSPEEQHDDITLLVAKC